MKTALACAVLVAAVGQAGANGRPPVTNGAYTHPTEPSTVFVRSTFGLLISKDDGCTFRWVCEQAIGYGGTYDPKYAIANDGTIFATTFQGLRVSRDGGCTFTTATAELPAGDPNRLADLWVDAIDLAPNGEVWIATAEGGAKGGVFRSTDNGRTFAPAGLMSATILWRSLAVSKADAMHAYVAGYDLQNASPTAHLYATANGGTSWDERPLTGIATAPSPLLHIAATDPTNPLTFYLTSIEANPPDGDRLYRTTDGGQTFVEVLATTTAIAGVVADASGVIVVAGTGGTFRSTDGITFAAVTGTPQLGCLAKRGDGSFVGCGTNWDPDFMAVARTSNLDQWSKMFRFVELAGPLECPAQNECTEPWVTLQSQFGASGPTCGVSEPPAPPSDGGGCCDAGTRTPWGSLMFGLVIAWLTGRTRRARSSAASRPRPR